MKDPKIVAAIKDNLKKNNPYIAVFLARDDSDLASRPGTMITSPDQVHPVGVLAQIYNLLAEPGDSVTALVYPHRRVRMTKFIAAGAGDLSMIKITDEGADMKPKFTPSKGIPRVLVDSYPDEPIKNKETVERVSKEIVDVLNEMGRLNPLVRDQIMDFVRGMSPAATSPVTPGQNSEGNGGFAQPSKLADFAAAMSDVDSSELQEILEATSVEERLKKSLAALKKELRNAQLQHHISEDLQRMIGERDREYFLQERLKTIQKELGLEVESREKVVNKYRARAAKLQMPEPVKKVFSEELKKLQNLKPAAQEYNLTNNYLDWLTQVPWGKRSEENFDLSHAQNVLDEDHYGLKDVKDRILEFIAVGKLRGTVEGKILCLSGPPGVGKTSIGKSIARALNREYFRFSVGGLYDVAEIKGHRRTYVGAMPGKLVQALKKVQSENPLILIDEVDKIGRGGHNGDPSSALLEVLDPEQNSSFLDHYMDVPIDLSKTLFVCTANVLDTIPAPLLDRMEVISLSGYVAEEKVAIAQQYLVPQALKSVGLPEDKVDLTAEALQKLIHQYCRENGVRNLKKHVEKIYRKAAYVAVTDESEAKITITPDNLKDYVGGPVFTSDRLYPKTPKGVIMGLAYNSLGGASLYIESVLELPWTEKSRPNFHRTGNMGDVMKESTSIAYSYAKAFLSRHYPSNKFLDHASVHLHVPEGATPKDGPSAGIAMCSSLLSLALDRPIEKEIAMTGELTLTGKVLRIGGVKEKLIAAKRSGVTEIIFPAGNQADYDALDAYLREGIQAHFVDNYEDVASILFSTKAE